MSLSTQHRRRWLMILTLLVSTVDPEFVFDTGVKEMDCNRPNPSKGTPAQDVRHKMIGPGRSSQGMLGIGMLGPGMPGTDARVCKEGTDVMYEAVRIDAVGIMLGRQSVIRYRVDALNPVLEQQQKKKHPGAPPKTISIGSYGFDVVWKQYLRKPDFNDIQKLYTAHNNIHGFPGMLGSIDCMHWEWRNCPKAWHGQFGRVGANNDLTVLNNSPLFDDLLDDIDPVAPFECNGVTFEKGYYDVSDEFSLNWHLLLFIYGCKFREE
ncbi:ALP1-like protein isoform X1 [Tanacetum coccineum]